MTLRRQMASLKHHWIVLLCSGVTSWLVGNSSSLAQPIKAAELLPPPPPTLFPLPELEQPSTPRSPLQAPPASDPEAGVETPINYERAVNSGRYWVYVNGDSPYLLQQVQLIEPRAYLQRYQGRQVIQAGTFNNAGNAQQMVAMLGAQGIRAEIATNNASSPDSKNHFYIIIPGTQAEIAQLTELAIRLGVRPESIQAKDVPLGPHLRIGPFNQRGEAEDVNRYLQRGGMDSRVHYSRK